MGIAEQQSTRMISEGQKDAKIELARAERGALEEFTSAMREDRIKQSEYMLAQRYNELISECARVGSKTIYLPYEATGLGGLVSSLHKVYGPEGKRSGPPRKGLTAASFEALADATNESALD